MFAVLASLFFSIPAAPADASGRETP